MTYPSANRSERLLERLGRLDSESLDALGRLIDLLPQAPALQDRLKQGLLAHYAERDPQSFFQFDAFIDVEGDADSMMHPDHEGDCVLSGVTQELMTGACAVRVLITPGTSPEKASDLLHKIAGYVAKDGFTFHQPELERLSVSANYQTSDDYLDDTPF